MGFVFQNLMDKVFIKLFLKLTVALGVGNIDKCVRTWVLNSGLQGLSFLIVDPVNHTINTSHCIQEHA